MLQLTINVDETMFKDVLEKELKALKPEDIKEILVKSIGDYFEKEPNIIKNLIVDNNSYYSNYKPTEFTKAAVESCDFSALQGKIDEYINILTNQWENILRDVAINAIIQRLTNTYEFENHLRSAFDNHYYTMKQRERNNGN